MQKLFALILFFVLFQNIQAQSFIGGIVKDSSALPLQAVSIQLSTGGKFISGTTTDENGRFRIFFSADKMKQYKLQFSAVGFLSHTISFVYQDSVLKNIVVLKHDRQSLSAVTVTAKRTLVERKVDRSVINVENSFLSNGFTGLDVLQRSPGLWVDNNGTIRINGSRSVTVMINDIIQRMSGEELAEYLRTLRSEDISKIEIIQNPPSEFEASGSGGIVHIILKKSARRGLIGNVNTQYRQQGIRPMMRIGTTLDYKRGNLYLFGGYNKAKEDRDISERASIDYSASHFTRNIAARFETIFVNQYRFGFVYEFNPKHSIGSQTIYTRNEMQQSFLTNVLQQKNSQQSTGINTANRNRLFRYGGATLNYSWKMDEFGSSLKIIGDYGITNREEVSFFREQNSDSGLNKIFRLYTPFTTDNYSLQADYTKQWQNKSAVKMGAKLSSIERDNELLREDYLNNKWEKNLLTSNHFIYREGLLMFYASYEKTINQFSVKGGLRYEKTFSDGNSITTNQKFSRRYGGLFPSLFLSQNIDSAKGNSVYINYSKRLQRPSLSELNPNRMVFGNYTATKGDPDLLPQYTHNITAGLKWKHEYMADLYLARTENVISLRATTDSNNVILYQVANILSTTEYGVNFSAPIKIMKGWTSINNLSFYHFFFRFDGVRFSQLNFSARTIQNITLQKILDIDVVADYRSPFVYANLENPSLFYLDVGFSKKLWKNKWRLRLACTDVFNTVREKEYSNNDGTIIQFYRKRPSRSVGLTISYSFSAGKKFTNKEINQGNAEERSRTGN